MNRRLTELTDMRDRLVRLLVDIESLLKAIEDDSLTETQRCYQQIMEVLDGEFTDYEDAIVSRVRDKMDDFLLWEGKK